MPPLRNAMRLVNGYQRGFALGQHLAKTRHAETLWRNEQELQTPIQIIHAGLPRHASVKAGVNPSDLES